MRLERFGERDHSIADIAVLLAVVCVALVTWSNFAGVPGAPLWRSYASVGLTVLLALAAQTRHLRWAASIRFLLGGWMIVAPYLLGFAHIAPGSWAYLAIGTFLTTASFPVIVTPKTGGARVRSSEVDFNLGRESPSQTQELERDGLNLNLAGSKLAI